MFVVARQSQWSRCLGNAMRRDRPRPLLRCRHDRVFRGAGVKAVVYDRYGLPDVLRVGDVPIPSPAAGQVRVKVAATSVNLSDWE